MTINRTVIVSLAIAAAIFTSPPSASATEAIFTDDHVHVEENEKFAQSFEGYLSFTNPAIPPLGIPHTRWSCDVTIEFTTTGPTTGIVTQFSPTTTSCDGEGPLFGCEVEADNTNIGETTWTVNTDIFAGLVVQRHSGNLTIHNEYAECPVATSHLEFSQLKFSPSLDFENTIFALTVSGKATNGVTSIFGVLIPEFGETLGLVEE